MPGGGVVGDRGQRLVVDLDQLGRVLGEVAAVRDDQGDRVAGEPGLAVGERRPRRVRHLVPGPGVPGLADVAVEVGGGEDGVHAGQRQRGRRVDRDDARPRVRAADEAGVQHARPGDVVDEGARAGQQPGVLDALHPAAGVAGRPDGVTRSLRHHQRQPLPAAHRRGVLHLGLVPVDLPGRPAPEDLLERDAALQPGQGRAEAVVRAEDEGQVQALLPVDVEPVRVVEAPGSRLAAPTMHSIALPAGTVCPYSSTSRVT